VELQDDICALIGNFSLVGTVPTTARCTARDDGVELSQLRTVCGDGED